VAYSDTARDRRRCTAATRAGEPCRRWAAWGDPGQRCPAHGGRSTGKPTCSCAAYNWPHRPGGGWCRWPDAPLGRLTTPASTHGDLYNAHRQFGALAYMLEAHWRERKRRGR
jgi:hypothetical protein